MTKQKKKEELKAADFLNGVPAELRALLEQIDIENDHEHDEHCGHHVHGPGCNH